MESDFLLEEKRKVVRVCILYNEKPCIVERFNTEAEAVEFIRYIISEMQKIANT